MDRAEASEKIKAHCKTIALEMMDLNPTITHLNFFFQFSALQKLVVS